MPLKAQIREFIINNFLFGATDTVLEDNGSFLQKGILDSTGILEVVGFLEEKYGIKIEDDELVPENLDSIECIVRFVSSKNTAKF
jgi:acyl carrier protein